MGSQDYELVRLFAALKLADNIGRLDRSADDVGNSNIGVDLLPRRKQAGDACGVFAGHHHLRDAIDLTSNGIGMTVKQVIGARDWNAMASAFCSTAREIMSGALRYSSNKSSHLCISSECTSRIFPATS